jgi:hypothetical protein
MDSNEARTLLLTEMVRYRRTSYLELQRLLNEQDTCEAVGPSGTKYQIEIQAFWDSGRGGDLRVRGTIDDGGLRAFVPLLEDFIVDPTGAFVGA